MVRSFLVPSPDSSRYTDIIVNYTVADEHGLAEGFVMRYGEVGEQGNVTSLRSYGEGNAWQQNPALGFIWRPQVGNVWTQNQLEVIEDAN
jgi:hypothetical protein